MEVIQAIALLCQVNNVATLKEVASRQLECQKYYIKCLDKRAYYGLFELKECIKEREVE